MSPSAAERQRTGGHGATLVELVIVIVVSAIVFLVTPILVFHGVKTLVFLPKALAVNDVATEVLHQIVEGGFSTLQSAPLEGLRFANSTVPMGSGTSQSALWLAEANRVGFLTSGEQNVLIRLDLDAETVKRSLPETASCTPTIGTEETIPSPVPGSVRILPTGSFFRYYNQSGAEIVTPLCPPGSCPPSCQPACLPSCLVDFIIRRVDIAFTAQTGNGNFDEGDASEKITSFVAIRVP